MIKILFLAANPSDTQPLQLAEEVRAIDEALQRGRYRDVFDLESHWAVRTSDVQELLLRHEPDIVHFSGHGSAGAIILEDEWGETREVTPRYLRTLFQAMAGKTRCVVLNACYSENQAADIVEEVGILIGMTDAIGDTAARAFSTSFYQALAYGQDVQTAFDLGREQISMDLSPEADVLRLLHAQGVTPGTVRFVQPKQEAPPPPDTGSSDQDSSLPDPVEQEPFPPNKKGRKIPAEILIPAITALAVALIGLIPYLFGSDRPFARAAPTSIPTLSPTSTATPTPVQAVVPTPLMPATGFNIAVAGFLEETATGELMVSHTSKAISEWLYEAVNEEKTRLPITDRYTVLEPTKVPSANRLTPEEHPRYWQGFADRNNITLLIYGVVRQVNGGKTVTLEFYVGEDSFSYGSEIVGSNRLGLPVAFQVPITGESLSGVNKELDSRTKVLRHVIAGLSALSVNDFEKAKLYFRDALMEPEWETNEGHEVVYLLIGATALAAYDQITNRTPLAEAKAAFEKAYALKPQYSRVLLGMGTVMLQEACGLNREETGCTDPDEVKLQDAYKWYMASLNAKEKQASYFVDLKAAYGLGQVELLGSEFAKAGFDLEKTQLHFKKVIELGGGYSSHTVDWYVGNAYGHLGRVGFLNGDFAGMAEMYYRSVEILDKLAPYPPSAIIARNWASIGYAEKQTGNEEQARYAYCQAVRVGESYASIAELTRWSAECGTGG